MRHQGSVSMVLFPLEMENFLFPQQLSGEKPGKTALITAGIHAGEYVGIQSAVELGRDLKLRK